MVRWEDDAAVGNCPYCAQTFSRFSQPKHHCRLCGKVVCGDTRTGCSREVAIDVDTAPAASEKTLVKPTATVSVRICSPCSTTLFAKRDFERSLKAPPAQYVRSYGALVKYKAGIMDQIPRFQRLVEAIAAQPGDRAAVVEAVRMKHRIKETLEKVDQVAKAIATVPAGAGSAEERVRRGVAAATLHWGTVVGPLVKMCVKELDDMVVRARPSARDEVMARLGKAGAGAPTTAVTRAEAPAERREDDAEAKARDVVVVLEEQKFLVLGMLDAAKKRRRFDEVEALGNSLDEIEREIERLGGAVVGV